MASREFFQQSSEGRFILLTSPLVADEIALAPLDVREWYDRFVARSEIVPIEPASVALQAAYLNEGILTPKWADDALHVALATVSEADLIVSWNFRHIVHFEKAPKFNALNRLKGYREVAIHSPNEVITYEDSQEI